jgi:hypothetical protein
MRSSAIIAVSTVAWVAVSAVVLADPPAGGVETTAPEPAPPSPPRSVGYGAMPGGLHVATAETLLPGTVELAALSGYGYRKGLLAADHTLNRAIADLAVAYAPLRHLALGLSLDGRYDKHTGMGMTDDGYVGDPHLLARFASPIGGGRAALGGQLGIWVPGKDAPSVALSATSFDLRALLSIDAGFGTLSIDAGFRVDNSVKSVDHPEHLTVEDRVSLGVSAFNAALAGASLRVPVNPRTYVALEASTDVFVGSGAPGPIVRGGAQVGIAVTEVFTVVGFLEGAKVPGISYGEAKNGNVVLVPYEPIVTAGLGFQARFGGGPRRVATGSTVVVNKPAPVIETADVSGIVFDDGGKPVVAATVTLKLKNHTGTAVTDSKGAYTIAKLPIGQTVDGRTELDDTGAEVSAELANKKPGSVTVTLGKGANAVPPITLDPMLPPGELRAVIINVGTSRPVANAAVTIEPGGATATSGPDGKFTVNLPPGHYKLTVTARGLAQQQLDVNIEQNGVAIKNIDMHK